MKVIENKLEVMCAQMSQLISGGRSPVTGTDAHHGASIISELKSVKAYLEVDATEGPTILSAENVRDGLQLISNGHKEEHLVALYTPFFQNIIDEVNHLNHSQLKLVNSENFTWLQVFSSVSNKDLKPDLFVASHENVLYKAPYANAPVCNSDRAFGKFDKWRCRDSLNSIWDAKVNLNDEGMGKVFRYVQIAGQECKNYKGNAAPMRGVVFDAEKMMLITGLRDRICSATVLKLAAAGSREYLIDFLRQEHDEWAAAVRVSCLKLEVALGGINVDLVSQSQILLGAGGYGRAYRLEGGALKISLGRSMEKEYGLMGHAYLLCPDYVVQPLKYHEQIGDDGNVLFSAYTMADCGRAVDRPVNRAMWDSLTNALFRLHEASLVHGDARLENIVMLDNSLKWIDFYDSFSSANETNKTARRTDVNALLRSVFGQDVDISISDVNVYLEKCTPDSLKSLGKF